MTIGEYRGTPVNPRPNVIQSDPKRLEIKDNGSTATSETHLNRARKSMPPPLHPASRSFGRNISGQQPVRPSPPAPRPSIDEESLFVGDDEDREQEERTWGEKNNDEDEGQLRWVGGLHARKNLNKLIELPGLRRRKFQENSWGV